VTSVDILIVDDNSPDGTGALADGLADADSSIQVLHRSAKEGLGPAYIAGFRWALGRGYRFVAEMDADGSHDPASLVTLLDIAENTDAALVLGSRWVRGGAIDGWSRNRELLSRAGNAYARLALGSRIHDLTGGFRVISTDALRQTRPVNDFVERVQLSDRGCPPNRVDGGNHHRTPHHLPRTHIGRLQDAHRNRGRGRVANHPVGFSKTIR
jgi:glycosyltransferase involved in cell wall biosynthesis